MISIKLLTLNAHSFLEQDSDKKLLHFAKAVAQQLPDVVALQEVSQTVTSQPADKNALAEFVSSDSKTIIKEDNFVLRVIKLLADEGIKYHWSWLPIKLGYGKLDEGIAVMTRNPIQNVSPVLVSRADDFENWKTRKILGVTTEGEEWFYSVHYGWWNDKAEPFFDQWEKTLHEVSKRKKTWLMGDFNNPAQVKFEGYDLVTKSGFHDSFLMAKNHDSGITVRKHIDGWENEELKRLRIDQIWCSEKVAVKSSRVIFSGHFYPVVSDHCGVIVQI